MSRADDVVAFWFSQDAKRWFANDAAFDATVRDRFADDVARAQRGDLDDWCATPRGCLALVLLLDQCTRNIHRGSAGAFAGDAHAQRIVLDAVARGDDQQLSADERRFLYMPLMHAEDLALQDRGLALFSAVHDDPMAFAKYARMHRDVIARFGRFPHRNAVLGRTSTPEELEFLKQPGSSF